MAPKSTKSFRISEGLAQALAAEAAAQDRSEGWIIEQALTIYLKGTGSLPADQPKS